MKKILLAALLISSGAFAQTGGWDLRTCINYALDNNISVKQSRISVEQKEIDLNTAKNSRLPSVSGGASQNFSFGRGLNEDNLYVNTNTTSTSFSLGANVPIFQGFEISNGIKMSELDLAAATEDLEKAKDDIRVAVAQAFVQILYSREIASVARNQVELDSMQVERISAMMANGKASSAELAAQQASLAQSRLSETQARNNFSLAILEMTQLLELPSPEGFGISYPDPDKFDLKLLMNPEEIYAEAVNIKPAIQSQKLRLDYAGININRAKGGYLPTLSLSGGVGSNYYTSSGYPSKPFGEQLSNNFSQYIGLSLNIPVFSRFSVRNQVKSAKLSYDNQQLQLENTKKALYKEIQQAYYNAVASQSKQLSSKEAASSAKHAFTLVTEKYENGKANITEYNESKNRYLEAESNFLQARYECLYQTSLLDFYRGKELDF